MKVQALRGVCIGPGQHLLPGDEADIDNGTAQFLLSIKAVEPVPEAPAPEPAPRGRKPRSEVSQPQQAESAADSTKE